MIMNKHWRWKVMPSFPKLTIPEIQDKDDELREIGQFIVGTYPLGFRGAFRKIKYLRNLLYSVPYITGSIPKFRLIIKHTNGIELIPFRVNVSESKNDNLGRIILWDRSDTGEYIGDIEAPMVSRTGQYRYSIGLQSSVNASCNSDIIVFKAIAQESITLILYGFLLGVVSSLLTWLLAQ